MKKYNSKNRAKTKKKEKQIDGPSLYLSLTLSFYSIDHRRVLDFSGPIGVIECPEATAVCVAWETIIDR